LIGEAQLKLPNYQQAVVPERKITAYLLSPTHPDGSGKEKFFAAFGFCLEEWEVLATALVTHVAENNVTKV
jgi:hypothetical protein